jgi:hypothetical protein
MEYRAARFAMPLLVLLLVACSSAEPAVPTPAPVRLLTARQVQGRMWDLTVDSPALGKGVNVRVLLPARYDAEPNRRWPVLCTCCMAAATTT